MNKIKITRRNAEVRGYVYIRSINYLELSYTTRFSQFIEWKTWESSNGTMGSRTSAWHTPGICSHLLDIAK